MAFFRSPFSNGTQPRETYADRQSGFDPQALGRAISAAASGFAQGTATGDYSGMMDRAAAGWHDDMAKNKEKKGMADYLREIGASDNEVKAAMQNSKVGAALLASYTKKTDPKPVNWQTKEAFNPKTNQVELVQVNPQTGETRKLGLQGKPDDGFEFTTDAEGNVTLRKGPGASMGRQEKKNQANTLKEIRDDTAAAASTLDNIKIMREANKNTGYTGVGGETYDKIDSTLESFGWGDILPGTAAARSTMKKGGMTNVLESVQKTKGAISNMEMKLFMASEAGLTSTPEGNEAMLNMGEAIANRQIERAEAAEKWNQENGTLQGFETAWARHIQQNPLIVPGPDGLATLNRGQNNGGGGFQPTGVEGVSIRRK